MKRYNAPAIELLQIVSKEDILNASGEINKTLTILDNGLSEGDGNSIGTSQW